MAGNSAFLSTGNEYLGKLLEFRKAGQGRFRVVRQRGLSLETLQHKRVSSSMQVRILSFAWSCGGKLRVPLELPVDLGDPLVSPQAIQISCGIARGTLGFLAHHCRDE